MSVQCDAVDPRFKLGPFDDEQTRRKATAATLAMMESHQSTLHLTGPPSEHAASTSVPSSMDNTGPAAEHATTSSTNTVSPTLSSAASSLTTSSTSLNPAVHHEFTAYTSEPTICQSECPLSWWSVNHHKYPLIANVARRLLSVPATSCCSSRLYTKQHEMLMDKRDTVQREKDEQLLFCMENL